jgi:nucleoside-diphosphate-sugar epimerase
VVFSRRLLRDLGYGSKEERKKLELKKGASSISDLRVIDMYEDAILDIEPLDKRVGNWVQEFSSDEDAFLFASAQFGRFQEVERFLEENFKNTQNLIEKVSDKTGVEL